ncbi:unnamed protein product [Bemisia tabaci]|uniref:Uncharacterized protein n=1 Tax=Bemisia tabaci TaxID=7038 RepID=A0A9P0AGP6_BEMTA|nr:unnamed protein product [Bemisia tabaci]
MAATSALSAVVFHNLSNMDTAIRALTNIKNLIFGLKPVNVLPDGGRVSPKRMSTEWSGNILEFETEFVQVFAISLWSPQKILIRARRVFLNDKLICQDTKRLREKQYRIGKDGSQWYTNLKVGRRMTHREKKNFIKLQNQVEKEKEQHIKGIIADAERRTRAIERLEGKKSISKSGPNFFQRKFLRRTKSEEQSESESPPQSPQH